MGTGTQATFLLLRIPILTSPDAVRKTKGNPSKRQQHAKVQPSYRGCGRSETDPAKPASKKVAGQVLWPVLRMTAWVSVCDHAHYRPQGTVVGTSATGAEGGA